VVRAAPAHTMDGLNKIKNKFINIVKKPLGGSGSNVRPVRVNLPQSLGGGFTMLMCFMDGGQSVAGFLRSLIGMLQATQSQVLHMEDYGLTPHMDEKLDSDEERGPSVFLHPDSLLADAFDDDHELNLDLKLLHKRKPSTATARNGSVDASASGAAYGHEEGTAGVTAESARSNGAPRRPPPPPTPTAETLLLYSAVTRLKRLRPPVDPPPEIVALTPLAAPCTLAFHLIRPLPPALAISPLTVALQARQGSNSAKEASAAAAASAANVAAAESRHAAAQAATPAAAAAELSKKDRKEQERLAKAIDAYALHVYDLLLLRGVGEDPHLKLQLAAQLLALKNRASAAASGERIGTSAAVNGAVESMWGGWENDASAAHAARAAAAADSIEVPLIFVRTAAMPKDAPKKFDVTADCLVLTNRRMLQISGGNVLEEMALGPTSGNVLKIPKATDDGVEGKCPLSVSVKNALEMMQAEKEGTAPGAPSARDGDEKGDGSTRRVSSRRYNFFVPNADLAGFLEEYLMYLQEKWTLETQIGLVEQARIDRAESARIESCLKGWTSMLKSLVGPMLFGPAKLPSYEHSIKQVLARVEQMDIKQVTLTSLRLLSLSIPELDPATASGPDGDQIPSLRLSAYTTDPEPEYVFDIYWSAPSFSIKIEIAGRKIVSFKLVLEMKGVEVRGSIRLRSSPYAPEKSAVSFVSVPQLSFGVGSHVIVGSIKLPFQRAIEKIIYTQIQAALESALRDNIVGDKWQSIAYSKSGPGLLLDRWSSWAAYPFKYDGTDDEEMMSLALVVTAQAASGLEDTLATMKDNRDKMMQCLGKDKSKQAVAKAHAGKHADKEDGAGAAASSSGSRGSHSRKNSSADPEHHAVEEDDRSARRGSGSAAASASNGSRRSRRSTATLAEEDEEDDEVDDAALAPSRSTKDKPLSAKSSSAAKQAPTKESGGASTSSGRRARRYSDEEEDDGRGGSSDREEARRGSGTPPKKPTTKPRRSRDEDD